MSGFNKQKYSCKLYIILATGSQNLGRLKRKLSQVLSYEMISQINFKLFWALIIYSYLTLHFLLIWGKISNGARILQKYLNQKNTENS